MGHCCQDCGMFCAAKDKAGRRCIAPAGLGMPWCARHNEERIKLYVNYKLYHAALDNLEDQHYCTSLKKIRVEADRRQLRAWHSTLMMKYRLLTRCIESREYFTERFFGSDMDFGHKQYWRSLVQQQSAVDALLTEIEGRTYQLILVAQNALWVLGQTFDDEAPTLECSGYTSDSLSSPDSSCCDLPQRHHGVGETSPTDIEDPLEVALRRKATAVREKIFTRLARYCAPPQSKFAEERLEIIKAVVRRAVYMDATLMVRSQDYDDPLAFVQDLELDVGILNKIWDALKELYVHEARAAVDDVLRGKCDEAEFVVVLGGRVYKDITKEKWPFHAWGHITSIIKCYTCVRKTCHSVDEISDFTRYCILLGLALNQSYVRYWHGVYRSGVFGLCGSLVHCLEASVFPPRYAVTKCNGSVTGRAAQWSEMETNLILPMGLALDNPHAEAFIDACRAHPDFMILWRKGKQGRVQRSHKEVWVKRVRRARTRAGLQKVDWGSLRNDSKLFLKDSAVNEGFVRTWPDKCLEECWQLVVVDTQADGIGALVAKIADLWLGVHGVKCGHDLYNKLGRMYEDSGEIERVKYRAEHEPHDGVCCQTEDYMSPTERDVYGSYVRLWRTTPTGGRVCEEA